MDAFIDTMLGLEFWSTLPDNQPEMTCLSLITRLYPALRQTGPLRHVGDPHYGLQTDLSWEPVCKLPKVFSSPRKGDLLTFWDRDWLYHVELVINPEEGIVLAATYEGVGLFEHGYFADNSSWLVRPQ